MPVPRENESRSAYIQRCMDDEGMKKKHPNVKERVAVCHGIYDSE